MKYSIKVMCMLLVITHVIVTSSSSDIGCCFQRWWKKNFGIEQTLVDRPSVEVEFDPHVVNEMSLELWRLDNNMVGVTDITTSDGRRHIQIATTHDARVGDETGARIVSAVEQQTEMFTKFRSTMPNVKHCLVTLFYVQNQYGIFDAVANSHQRNFTQQTGGVIPVVCSYVPAGGRDHQDKNHFRYMIRKDKAECDVVTPTHNGTTMNLFAEHSRKGTRLTSPMPGVSVMPTGYIMSREMSDEEMEVPLL